MEFKVGDRVKTKLYGNSFEIESIKKEYVIVNNNPYKSRKCECRLMIEIEKFKEKWHRVRK